MSGASRGIGLSLAKLLSQRTDTGGIWLCKRSGHCYRVFRLDASNSNVHVVMLDVTSKQSALAAASQVKTIMDGIDVLILNAASVIPKLPFYPLLQARQTKKILFASSIACSIASNLPLPMSANGHSKAAVNYTAKAISLDLKDQGFIVVAYNSGLVSSDMMGIYDKEKVFQLAPGVVKMKPQLRRSM
ncbi:hypothetical protein V1514DRAFT_322238 [Lipomyces japonicus]|uniref:uncharacterized protein n=1 Tax=Lipomyces japonicus TaxID=56871 RepID=UPI0034CDDC4D